MTALSSEPYKGTRDFYPEDMRVREYIFRTWRNVVRRYGYESYDAPLLESIDIYAAKSGSEIVNEQTYQFVDRGDRRVAIRPELTPSVSRMIASRRQETPLPARWYNIGQFMRYERPQRGREREFWQLNVDMFGGHGPSADAEIITVGAKIMEEFGADSEMYTIRINNRRLINTMMAHHLGLDTIQAELMIKLFDRKDKISHEEFRDQAIEIFGHEAASQGLQKIVQLLAAKSMDDLPENLRDTDAVKETQVLFTILDEMGIKNARFDITLMRGFDYYTGVVFEFFDNHPENKRALFGGGRYDGLVGLFGAEPLSAVGMAPGYTMTELFLQTHKLLPKFTSRTDLYIVVLPGAESGARKLAQSLRQENVNVELDISNRKLDKQLKTAIKKTIPYILFVGENELRDEIYPMKNLATGDEEKVSLERIVTTLHDRRTRARTDDDELFQVDA